MSLHNTPSFAAASLLVYSNLLREKPNLLKLPSVENGNSLLMEHDAKSKICYDAECRNPLFANAQLSVDTELLQLARHYHPSVKTFAESIINGKLRFLLRRIYILNRTT